MKMWIEDIAAVVSLALFIVMMLIWAAILENPEWLDGVSWP